MPEPIAKWNPARDVWETDPGVHLRALGRVLGDLSDLGYDTSWHGLRAADVGAPHGRFRVFVVATDTQSNTGRIEHGDGGAAAIASGLRRGAGGPTGPGEAPGGWAPADVAGRGDAPLLGTPRASEWKGCGPVGSKSHAHRLERDYLDAQVLSLLPTPTSQSAKHDADDRGPGTLDDHNLWSIAARLGKLLPTPRAGDGEKGGPNQAGSSGDLMLPSAVQPERWGQYGDAIHRWEQSLYAQDRIAEQLLIPGYVPVGRPAPAPTEVGPKGNPRLSAAFSEWMMGLPAGWVTDVPGITRNEALKALGNGVVPQQAAAALREMFAWEQVSA